MMVLITYDVSTTSAAGRKRLNHIAKICLDYGQRVQNSVFECIVDPVQWEELKSKLLKKMNTKEDSLRFYFLGKKWETKVKHVGIKKSVDMEGFLNI